MQSFLLPNSDKTKMIKSKNWQKDFCWQLLYSFFGSAYQRYHKDLKMSFLVLAVSDNNSCLCFIRIDYSNFLFLSIILSKTLWFDPISTIWNLTWINSNLNRSEGGFDDVQNSKWNSLTMLITLNTVRSMSPFLFILRFEKKSANSRAVSCHGTTDICLHDSV